ncbi:hypothetical protein FT663_05017 [Candidozyma haemuli var. vulneris]|nr:hypothetical protein FT663_05017 [[Candida] haemuloni var. vulneris]KAF3988009.1 hypothetical protein FT662_03662 [[Candida] haemuloni var. vulneris]
MHVFQTGHEELVHDIKYDYYGKHVATASSDQHIKVFDLDSASSAWVLNDSWKAHDSSVVKLSWAHPEFSGQRLLASCSYDRTVKIWQESSNELHGSGRRWVKLATLASESFGPIYDVVFAPSHLGLKLACVGSDGITHIYESLEPSDLSIWCLTSEIPVLNSSLPAKSLQSSFCIEWCPAKFSKVEMLCIIALDQGFIYGTGMETQHTNVNNERAGDGLNISNKQAFDSQVLHDNNEKTEVEGAYSAKHSSAGDSTDTAKYVRLCSLPEHNGLIRSVSWAPSMGRSYHLIATGCKDGFIRIFKATEANDNGLKIELTAKLDDHKQEVWRVAWNSTGTILSSAGDDGKVRLWKQNYMNEWQCMSEINSSNRSDYRLDGDHDRPPFVQRPSTTR